MTLHRHESAYTGDARRTSVSTPTSSSVTRVSAVVSMRCSSSCEASCDALAGSAGPLVVTVVADHVADCVAGGATPTSSAPSRRSASGDAKLPSSA